MTLDEIGILILFAGISVCAIALAMRHRRFRDVSNFITAAYARTPVTVALVPTGLPDWAEPAPPHPNDIFAYAGDVVFCDGFSRHPICTFVETVKIGRDFDPDFLQNWKQPKPKIGTMIDEFGLRCDICGASWYLGGNHFHFKDGWR